MIGIILYRRDLLGLRESQDLRDRQAIRFSLKTMRLKYHSPSFMAIGLPWLHLKRRELDIGGSADQRGLEEKEQKP